jgi:shikimate kinase
MVERNVVLTGFMGTGKSTVGRVLAEQLGHGFADTDGIIEARYGPIPAIFAEHGEGTFRRYERDVAEELAGRRGLVIATGGRMMIDAVNAERLAATGDVFCLSATIDTILERVAPAGDAASRPMLAGDDVRGSVERLLAERAPVYAAFRVVDTDGRTPHDIAAEIAALVTA